MFFDSHAHLTYEGVFEDIDNVLKEARESRVEKICNICTDVPTAKRGLALAEKHPSWIYNIGATTPHDVEKEGEANYSFFEKLAKEKKLVAVGETGLDYFYEHSDKKLQKEFLIRYLHLAQETNLPVVIHCRDAFHDLFDITKAEYSQSGESLPLLLHCFTGDKEDAKIALDRGWKISLSGIVTFKKSTSLQEVAEFVPLNSLFIETDTPYLAPQSKRGKPNRPAYVVETAEVIAKLKSVTVEELASQTYANAENFFNIASTGE